MIRWSYAFIDRPRERLDRGCTFWTRVTGTRASARRGPDREFVTLRTDGADAYLKLQGVGDGSGAHLDLCVDDIGVAAATARRLGATLASAAPDLIVMRSPGGQPFCLVPWAGEQTRPPPVPDGSSASSDGSSGSSDGSSGSSSEGSGGGAALSRLDQVCVDIAPQRYPAEVAFWREFTGWEHRRGGRPEFDLLRPPPKLPVRILLQRLDTDRPTSSHLDFACGDRAATRDWHQKLGATVVGEWPDWIAMRDPTGGIYCLTRRDPWDG